MRPPSYRRSVVDRNVVMWRTPVYILKDCSCLYIVIILMFPFLFPVHQDPAHSHNYSSKKCLQFNYDSFTPCQLCTEVANLVVCGIILV